MEINKRKSLCWILTQLQLEMLKYLFNKLKIRLISGVKLKSITRENAEYLFNHLTLIESNLFQNKQEIKVKFEFLNNIILVIKYNYKNSIKKYFVIEN